MTLGDALIGRYLVGVDALSIHPRSPSRAEIAIAYTPMHGVGADLAETVLARSGFTNVHTVASQREPDGHFPTVRFPNPEEPGAMDAVLSLARSRNADIALANDPDADRLAVAVRVPDTQPPRFRVLTGNEIGVLFGDDRLQHAGARATVATTIVSSQLLKHLAHAHGAGYFETLTGFKWIANEAMRRVDSEQPFVLGYEEAIGYTLGELVRDKDGISAAVGFAEMTAALAERGVTVHARLEALYREHGLFVTGQRRLTLSLDDPRPSLTDRLRASRPTEIAGHRVQSFTDLKTGRRDQAGISEPVDLPASDVLIFELADSARVIVRPSGTEPKVKCYYEVRSDFSDGESFAEADARARGELEALMDRHQAELAEL